MCRHCERLVEDKAHAGIVHAFMELMAAGVNRTIREKKLRVSPVTANDIDIDLKVAARPEWRPASESMMRAQARLINAMTRAVE